MYAAIAMSAVHAGLELHDLDDLRTGRAMAADFTGEGLRSRLGIQDIPTIHAEDAGRRLAKLGLENDFSMFEYWLSDYAGHGQEMAAACDLLATFDRMLAGLLEDWKDRAGLILFTSDHGNLEDLSTRRHTLNPVPALVVGSEDLRREFCASLHSLLDVEPAIRKIVGV
jgi:bisphosphoglycerate-independent phosphoglycerate mutase (AlkP superfamily)